MIGDEQRWFGVEDRHFGGEGRRVGGERSFFPSTNRIAPPITWG